MVDLGLFFWSPSGGPAMRMMRSIIPGAARSMNVLIAAGLPAPRSFVPEEHHHKVGSALLLVRLRTRRLTRVWWDAWADVPPLFSIETMPYVALQQMQDEPNAWGSTGTTKAATWRI